MRPVKIHKRSQSKRYPHLNVVIAEWPDGMFSCHVENTQDTGLYYGCYGTREEAEDYYEDRRLVYEF